MDKSHIASQLAQLLRTLPGHLYGIIDAGVDEAVLPTILAAPNPIAQTLFEGERARQLAHVGPYLVDLGEGHEDLLHEILVRGWGHSWGLFLTSSDDFAVTRARSSQYLTAKLPSQRSVYFRFFDPRVMSDLAPTLDAEQALICTRTMAFEVDGGHTCQVIERVSQDTAGSAERCANGLIYRKFEIPH